MWEKVKIIMSNIWVFVLPFLRQLMKQAGPVLASAALAAVQATASSLKAASGTEKRQAAFDAIVADLSSQGLQIGIDVSTSMINAAIEVALQKIKVE